METAITYFLEGINWEKIVSRIVIMEIAIITSFITMESSVIKDSTTTTALEIITVERGY